MLRKTLKWMIITSLFLGAAAVSQASSQCNRYNPLACAVGDG